MFKSIQWRLVFIFVLLVLAIMVVFGTIMQEQIAIFYHDNFIAEMQTAFSDELTSLLKSAAESEKAVDRLEDVLNAYSGRLGINTNRSYAILDIKNGDFLSGSDTEIIIGKTDNIITAMSGKVGCMSSIDLSYIDYAYPITEGNGYIIYVRDTKEQVLALIRNIFGIVVKASLIGVLISMILGFLFSKTFTRPIKNLTQKAELLASGSRDTKIAVKSNDELGKLASTFNYMSMVINSSMDTISQEKNKLETVLQHLNDGVMAFDVKGKVMLSNSKAKEMFAISNEDEIEFDSFFKNLNVNIKMAEILYLDITEAIEKEIDFGAKYFNTYFAPFRNDDDKLKGVAVVIQDATKSQQLELSRREFVANVSHELRTPLTTIKTYAETLADTIEEEQTKYFLNVIEKEADRMTRIVKELLVLSSLDHNKLSLNKKHLDLNEIIKDVVAKLSMDASTNHKQTITYSQSTKIPLVNADSDRIEQVLINIISNAVKYTPEGGKIEVFAGCLYNEVYIKIKDNGIGIPKDDIPHLFERFYRVDKARSRDKGGTGLGLAIAAEIVELHGGTIKIESEVGKGTEVIIKLPAVTADEM